MNKFAKWLRDESDHHLSRGTTHFIGDEPIYSVQVGMLRASEEINDLEAKIKQISHLQEFGYNIDEKYDPEFGDDKSCKCGHPYYRHFDTYEDMYPCGCKYCGCRTFDSPENPQ